MIYPLIYFRISIYLIICYLIGSIPTGFWLAKELKGIDIRTVGSGSTGATNVYRNVGKWAGISVFIIDFLKGYLPVLLACLWAGLGTDPEVNSDTDSNLVHVWTQVYDSGCFPVLAAAATLIGHSRSIFLNFKGGKSAATGLGTLFALNFKVGLCTFGTWMVVLYLGKMVSLASVLATASCIPYMIFFGGPPSYIIYCILGFLYVAYRHKDNIKRIMSGTEPKIGKGKQ